MGQFEGVIIYRCDQRIERLSQLSFKKLLSLEMFLFWLVGSWHKVTYLVLALNTLGNSVEEYNLRAA